MFENNVLNEPDKPETVNISDSDTEIEKPPQRMETSEDLFDSLIGEVEVVCFRLLLV